MLIHKTNVFMDVSEDKYEREFKSLGYRPYEAQKEVAEESDQVEGELTKVEIISKLTEKGIKFDSRQSKAKLKELLESPNAE